MMERTYSKAQTYFMTQYKGKDDHIKDRVSQGAKKNQHTELINPGNTWESTYHRNKVKLALMVLLYVYSNDDGEISKAELKGIKKLHKGESKYLSLDDQKEIFELASRKMTLDTFIDYIEKNEYQETIFNDACILAKTIINKSGLYLSLLEDLRSKYNLAKR